MRAVIPAVDYADILAVTLPAWAALLPQGCLTVVTTPKDAATRAVADACGVKVHLTDAWYRADRSCHFRLDQEAIVFNKALALDEAFGFLSDPPAPSEVCVSIDADGYPIGRFPYEEAIPASAVVGAWRYNCATQADLVAHLSGDLPRTHFPKMKNSEGGPVGYLQAFRYQPGMRFGSYPNAGKYDIHFMRKHVTQRLMVDESQLYILHLGPVGDSPTLPRKNWYGRSVPQWVTT